MSGVYVGVRLGPRASIAGYSAGFALSKHYLPLLGSKRTFDGQRVGHQICVNLVTIREPDIHPTPQFRPIPIVPYSSRAPFGQFAFAQYSNRNSGASPCGPTNPKLAHRPQGIQCRVRRSRITNPHSVRPHALSTQPGTNTMTIPAFDIRPSIKNDLRMALRAVTSALDEWRDQAEDADAGPATTPDEMGLDLLAGIAVTLAIIITQATGD